MIDFMHVCELLFRNTLLAEWASVGTLMTLRGYDDIKLKDLLET